MSNLTDELSSKELETIEKIAKEMARKAYEKAKQEATKRAMKNRERQNPDSPTSRKSVLKQLRENQQKAKEINAKNSVKTRNKSKVVPDMAR